MNALRNELESTVNSIELALEKKQVAQTIKSQINPMELLAIGAKNLMSMSTTQFGGLQFHASFFGKKPCIVTITLTAQDLYNVVIFTARGLAVIESFKGVYAENLEEIVIGAVEKRFRS